MDPLLGFRNLHQDLRCGLHSGIPWCCILFFTTVWWNKANVFPMPWVRWYFLTLAKSEAEYVQCPWCLVRRRVDSIRSCQCGWWGVRSCRLGSLELYLFAV